MSAALQRLHDSLAPLIAAAIAEVEAQRLADQLAAAEAIEAAYKQAPAALIAQARADQRRDILALIDTYRETLGAAGRNSLSLATLRRSIEAME